MNVLGGMLVVVLVSICFSVSAQAVNISAEKGIQEMRTMYLNQYLSESKRDGWRIQFYSTTDRRNMENTLRRLKNKYPNVKFSWVFNNPYYQVRAGAFLNRKESIPLQNELKKEFPGAFTVADQIDFSELTESY